jgi:hypothetical protein
MLILGTCVALHIEKKTSVENGDLVFEFVADDERSLRSLTVSERKDYNNKIRNHAKKVEKFRKMGLVLDEEEPVLPSQEYLKLRRQLLAEVIASDYLNSKRFRRDFRFNKKWDRKQYEITVNIEKSEIYCKYRKEDHNAWVKRRNLIAQEKSLPVKERTVIPPKSRVDIKSNGKKKYRKAVRAWNRRKNQAKLDAIGLFGENKPELSSFQ